MTAPPLTIPVGIVLLLVAAAAAIATYRRAWLGPAAIALSAPFAWYHQLGPTELTVSKAAFIGAAAGFIGSLLSDRARLRAAMAAIAARPAIWFLAAYALFSATSAAWAVSPADASRDALKWWWYLGALTLTAAAVTDRAAAAKVTGAIFATSVVEGIIGIVQSIATAPTVFVAGNGTLVGRIAATLEGPNQFGAYLECVIPLLLATLLFELRPRWVALGGALLLGLLCSDLLLTYSRGALWSCALALAFVVILYGVRRREKLPIAPAPAGSAAAILAIAAVVVVAIAHFSITSIGWQHEVWSLGMNDRTDSVEYRRALWSCAAGVFAQHPIVGVGAANFAKASSSCSSSAALSEHYNADHWYLETAADLGVVGLALLLAFLGLTFAQTRTAMLAASGICAGGFAVLIAFALHGLVDDVMIYPKAALTFFVVLGLLPADRFTRGSAGQGPSPA